MKGINVKGAGRDAGGTRTGRRDSGLAARAVLDPPLLRLSCGVIVADYLAAFHYELYLLEQLDVG